MAKCPAHEDGKASLHITDSGNKILIKCHAGCKTEDVLGAIGLTTKDLFAAELPRQAAGQSVEYRYTDRDGHLIATKIRKPGKDFAWRLPNGSYKLNGVKPPLYGISHVDMNCIYIAEGEKDADTLTRLGFPAVCSGMGAGKGKWKSEYTESLRGGKMAVVFQDNDAVGKDFARETCLALMEAVETVKLIDLHTVWADIPEHGDVTDYINKVWDDAAAKAAIRKLIDETPAFSPEKQKSGILSIIKPVSAFEETEAKWLVNGWIPSEQITLMAADGGVGKTSVCCDIIAAVSSGGRCILDPEGVKREPQKVVILTTEDSISKKLKKKLRLSKANNDNIFAPDPAIDKQGILRDLKFGSPAMMQLIRTLKPALCVLDPVQGYVPADINMGARNAMRDCMATLTSLGEETGCTFLVVCHSNKRRGASGRERISDSSDLWDISRSVIMAGFTENGEIRYLSNEKNNYAKQQETVLFSMNKVGLPEHEGFSSKHDRDFVTAANFIEKKEAPVNEALVEALKDEANPFEPTKFSYDSFEEKHGASIWGGKRPKTALDTVKPILEKAGVSLLTKQVKIEGRNCKGFVVQNMNTEFEQAAVCV